MSVARCHARSTTPSIFGRAVARRHRCMAAVSMRGGRLPTQPVSATADPERTSLPSHCRMVRRFSFMGHPLCISSRHAPILWRFGACVHCNHSAMPGVPQTGIKPISRKSPAAIAAACNPDALPPAVCRDMPGQCGMQPAETACNTGFWRRLQGQATRGWPMAWRAVPGWTAGGHQSPIIGPNHSTSSCSSPIFRLRCPTGNAPHLDTPHEIP